VTELYERIIAADGTPGLYESNYLKGNAPDGSGAFWVKHNLLLPRQPSACPPVAELWCVVWLADDGWRPQVWKRVVPFESVTLGRDVVSLDVGPVSLGPGRAVGELPGDPPVSWDLRWQDTLPPYRHFDDDWMYERPFPRKKLVTGSPRAVFAGAIDVGGRRVSVDGWVGHRNHNWGTEHAFRYSYGACNLWHDAEDLTLEGFTVQVKVAGPLRTPWLTGVGGLDRGERYGVGSLRGMFASAGRVRWPAWAGFVPERRGAPLHVRMELDPSHAVGLRYLHPDGQVSYCYNAKDATVVLTRGGHRSTSTAGELEFLFPAPIDGIPLHGEGTLDELAASVRP